jgi:hypothetical protein
VSLWRRHALEVLPELRREIIDPDLDSISAFCNELMSLARDAQADADLLGRIMEYALWCYRHRSHEVRNAIAVSFYEQVGGDLRLASAVVPLIPDYVVADIWGLWEQMLSEGEMEGLRDVFRGQNRRVPA